MKRAMLVMVLLAAALVPGDAWGRIFRRGYYGGGYYNRPYVNTGVYIGPRYRSYYPSYGGYGRYYGGYGGYGYGGYRGYSPYSYGRGFGVYPGVGISVGGFF